MEKIDIEMFIKNHQEEVRNLVNIALNRAGDIVAEQVKKGELKPNLQDVLPLMLYEVLVTNTVSTLRLAAEMWDEQQANKSESSVKIN